MHCDVKKIKPQPVCSVQKPWQ